jgi:hypothetical protein
LAYVTSVQDVRRARFSLGNTGAVSFEPDDVTFATEELTCSHTAAQIEAS